jgi:hypothetical protein
MPRRTLFSILQAVICMFIFKFSCYAQVPGQWVWKSGSSSTNYAGNFGTMGVASLTNAPPALYEAAEWTDLSGNFWLYGGMLTGGFSDDLWRFDPISNEWTWMKGHHLNNQKQVYGVRGVAASTNSPGMRFYSHSWTDLAGNLWLYGGGSYPNSVLGGNYGDLWKYNISTNEWIWMKGDSNANKPAHYGIKGVEDILNQPPASNENGISWTDNSSNLWLLDNEGALWRYRMTTNNWTWMKGDSTDTTTPHVSPVYGTKGVAAINNTPGFNYFSYTRWKDSKGDLWYLHSMLMVLWRYDLNNNMWTWEDGDTGTYHWHDYSEGKCEQAGASIEPHGRVETRACWVDACDNLWLMGGGNDSLYNDLIYYDTRNRKWAWADNDSSQRLVSLFGTKGVPSPTNTPASRCGAIPFRDRNGNFWIFGGSNLNGSYVLGDMWMYTIDTSCTKCHQTDVLQVAPEAGIRLYPNPTTGDFIVDAGDETLQMIDVLNVLGEHVVSVSPTGRETAISLHGYPSGIYYVRILTSSYRITTRIIVLN